MFTVTVYLEQEVAEVHHLLKKVIKLVSLVVYDELYGERGGYGSIGELDR